MSNQVSHGYDIWYVRAPALRRWTVSWIDVVNYLHVSTPNWGTSPKFSWKKGSRSEARYFQIFIFRHCPQLQSCAIPAEHALLQVFPPPKKKKQHFRFAKAKTQFANDEAHLKHNACHCHPPGCEWTQLPGWRGIHVAGWFLNFPGSQADSHPKDMVLKIWWIELGKFDFSG